MSLNKNKLSWTNYHIHFLLNFRLLSSTPSYYSCFLNLFWFQKILTNLKFSAQENHSIGWFYFFNILIYIFHKIKLSFTELV